MTKAKRAWRKGNIYVKSGQHAKAIYWLSRTQAILDQPRPTAKRGNHFDAGYMLVAFAALIWLWVSAPW